MEFIMSQTILIFILLFHIKYLSAEYNQSLCCPPGQYITTNPQECWEPATNNITKIRLSCENVITLSEPYDIVTEADELLSLNESDYSGADPEGYCIGIQTDGKHINTTKKQRITVLCDYKRDIKIYESLFGYCMIASVIFLAITALIYLALRELRDLQGKSIICFCTSLCIGMMLMVIIKFTEYEDLDYYICVATGFFAYYFILASFFWSNAISIQILKSTRQFRKLNHGLMEFLWYSSYAWGCPAILTLSMAIVNYHPGDHKKPGIGFKYCWFIDIQQQWYYLYSVIAVLIIVNICLFIYTATVIWRSKLSSNYMKAIKSKLTTTVRLLVIMGLPWIFEMIGSLVERTIFFTITDLYNTSQGLFIFLLLVVFRGRTLRAMYKRGWLNCIPKTLAKRLAVNEDDEKAIEHTDLPTLNPI